MCEVLFLILSQQVRRDYLGPAKMDRIGLAAALRIKDRKHNSISSINSFFLACDPNEGELT